MARRRKEDYFPEIPGAPSPLEATADRTVRFEEVDPLCIVWHGRYPSYLEDARTAFGERYGLAYLDMHDQGFVAPIVRMHLDYHAPLRFREAFTVMARLHWTDAARLNFEYRLTRADGEQVASGYTVQIFTDFDNEVLPVWPDYMEQLRRRWREGKWE